MNKKVNKNKVPKKEPYYVYVGYTDSCEGGEIVEGQSGPFSEREPTYHTYEIREIRTTDKISNCCFPEQIEVDFDPKKHGDLDVYLVCVRYSSGDTFGQSYGHIHFEGVYKDKNQALAIQESIENGKYTKSTYLPWKGYFERLEDVEVHSFALDQGCSSIIRH